jgi:hypothetical protein
MVLMKVPELLETIFAGSRSLGTFSLSDLIPFAASGHVNGIAVARKAGREHYLAFLNGEAEGAIYTDEQGSLYGDKAVMQIRGAEQYLLYDVQYQLVDALVMGCRIFEKSHLRDRMTTAVPEIGMKSQGIGVITLTIQRENVPQNGLRVSIRKDGKIVGSDVTTGEGLVSFRVMYGDYTCLVQERSRTVSAFQLTFDESNPKIVLEL